MQESTRRIDLATASEPISSYYGQRAVWTDYEGREHVGVLEADPMGSAWPVVRLSDGQYGRTGGWVEVLAQDRF